MLKIPKHVGKVVKQNDDAALGESAAFASMIYELFFLNSKGRNRTISFTPNAPPYSHQAARAAIRDGGDRDAILDVMGINPKGFE